MQKQLKGLVLSGGKGSRLRPFTYTGAKQMVPIANKPILFYAVEQLVDAGITEIGIITGDTGEQIRGALGDGSQFGAKFTFIAQDAPSGIAHAVKIAHPFLGDDPFVVFLGDNFLRGGINRFVEAFDRSNADCQLLLTQVPNPSEFGVALLDETGKPVKLIEKPKEPPTDLAIIGIYMFNKRFFEAVEQIVPSARGELEITDTIQKLLDTGAEVRAEIVRDSWIDTGRLVDLQAANRIVLDDMEPTQDGAEVDEGSKITGRVVVQAGAKVVNSVIDGPAIIGENTEVIDSYVGPYTSIYHDCRIIETEIASSVVLERSTIERPGTRIYESMIGRDVSIGAGNARPQALRLVLGDHSRIQVP
jgi:glucose-1-phosphate thymidylyltransferase